MTRYKFQLTYPWAPPVVLVLWCISFHVIWLNSPVVMEVPTVKTNRALKALCSSCKTSLPSRLSGKYAVRCVPLYCWPGFGCSGPWIPDWNEYWMQMVPHPDERNKRDQLQIEILFIIEKLVTYLKSANRILSIPLMIFVKKSSESHLNFNLGGKFPKKFGAASVAEYNKVISYYQL